MDDTRRAQATRHLSIAATILGTTAVVAGLIFNLGLMAIAGAALFIGIHLLLISLGGGAIAIVVRHLKPTKPARHKTKQ